MPRQLNGEYFLNTNSNFEKEFIEIVEAIRDNARNRHEDNTFFDGQWASKDVTINIDGKKFDFNVDIMREDLDVNRDPMPIYVKLNKELFYGESHNTRYMTQQVQEASAKEFKEKITKVLEHMKNEQVTNIDER